MPVVGHEHYAVSDRGRVRSLDHFQVSTSGVRRLLLGKPLTPDAAYSVKIDRKTRKVAHLVLEAFVGLCPEGMECCHWNDISSDNRLSNLRWATSGDNKLDMIRNGNHPHSKKAVCPRGHQLAPPNLVVSVWRQGRRQCRACHRANAKMQSMRRQGVEIDFQVVSDECYERLMRGDR